MVVCWFGWVLYFPTAVRSSTLRWTLYVVVLAACLLGYSKLITRYERTGRAIKIQYVRTDTKYRKLPMFVLAVRVSFFVIVAGMLALGLLPIRVETAHMGIVGSVLALFVLAIVSVVLEEHYVKTGVAERIRITDEQG